MKAAKHTHAHCLSETSTDYRSKHTSTAQRYSSALVPCAFVLRPLLSVRAHASCQRQVVFDHPVAFGSALLLVSCVNPFPQLSSTRVAQHLCISAWLAASSPLLRSHAHQASDSSSTPSLNSPAAQQLAPANQKQTIIPTIGDGKNA